MLFLLLIQIAMGILDFMLAPLSILFPFEVITPVYTLLTYVTNGVRFLTYFVFDAAVLRAVFTFILTLNALLFGFDMIWRIISYIKLSRDG